MCIKRITTLWEHDVFCSSFLSPLPHKLLSWVVFPYLTALKQDTIVTETFDMYLGRDWFCLTSLFPSTRTRPSSFTWRAKTFTMVTGRLHIAIYKDTIPWPYIYKYIHTMNFGMSCTKAHPQNLLCLLILYKGMQTWPCELRQYWLFSLMCYSFW